MNNKVNKNLFYVLPVIAILIVVAIGILFVQPKYNEINQLNVQKVEELGKQEKMQAKLRTLSALDSTKTDLQAQLSNLSVALPSQKEIPSLIIALQKISEASDIELQAIQLTPGVLLNDPATINKSAPELPLVINIRGNYEAVKTFLGRVYKAKRLLNMGSLSLNTSTAAGEEGQISASLSMSAFYQPLPPTPKDATEPLPEQPADVQELYATLEGFTAYTLDSTEEAPKQTESTPAPSASAAPTASASASPQ
jgi:Tfp pilus assembly protein PilO